MAWEVIGLRIIVFIISHHLNGYTSITTFTIPKDGALVIFTHAVVGSVYVRFHLQACFLKCFYQSCYVHDISFRLCVNRVIVYAY